MAASVPHYDVHGSGRPVVLLHSGGLAGAEWDGHLDALGRQFQLVVPDLPGHGRTSLAGDELTIEELAGSVVALLDEVGLERAHLVGSSMGGATALHVALKHRERVDRLVLFRIAHEKDEAAYAASRSIADVERWRRMGLADWLAELHEPQGGPDAWQQVLERVANAFATPDPTRHVTLDRLRGLDAPTLLIVGDRDPIAPLDKVLEMYQALPDAALWVLPDATHVTAVRTWRRALFDKEVGRFLRRRRSEA